MENEERLPGPVLLHLEPISCSMEFSRSRDPEAQLSSLTMRLHLLDDEVRTPDGRKLNGADWTITFQENGTGSELTKQYNAIGLINYYAEYESEYGDGCSPEGCHAWADVDSSTFTLLREMALAGKLPSGLRLCTYGMKYGWEPDGSAKEWDVKAYENAVIKDLKIFTTFVKPLELAQDVSEDDVLSVTQPASESPELVALRSATKAIERGNARLGWVVALLVVTLAVVILR
ncbi:hypothetical protein J2X04_001508 [Lysobacter niabensis]|uniref:Uncharacterized protein n=1 Tax=Agrilutibacter niabensis TaxID=380628 RepID=A0ABU1VNV4_9GAMM|nr:hypothetical protein [Lysobacter niabensis]MDR7099161.1 hypothetical protein [Lysobacter niabensis]